MSECTYLFEWLGVFVHFYSHDDSLYIRLSVRGVSPSTPEESKTCFVCFFLDWFFIVLHKTQSRVFFVTIACCWCFGVPLLCFFLFLVSLNVFCITTATTTRSHWTVFQSSIMVECNYLSLLLLWRSTSKIIEWKPLQCLQLSQQIWCYSSPSHIRTTLFCISSNLLKSLISKSKYHTFRRNRTFY